MKHDGDPSNTLDGTIKDSRSDETLQISQSSPKEPISQLASMISENQHSRARVREETELKQYFGEISGNKQSEPYHFHVYSHKHNTHITLTRPNRDPIISMSTGQIGFRKSQRKHFDSAYQLAAYVMNKIQERALLREIHSLELVFRGFGAGREAVTKALTGVEGRRLRGKIVRVTDATRLKFGGTRSRKPKRLG